MCTTVVARSECSESFLPRRVPERARDLMRTRPLPSQGHGVRVAHNHSHSHSQHQQPPTTTNNEGTQGQGCWTWTKDEEDEEGSTGERQTTEAKHTYQIVSLTAFPWTDIIFDLKSTPIVGPYTNRTCNTRLSRE
jgi:hypothetical protein